MTGWQTLEPNNDRALLTLAISALSWSVGRFEGMNVDSGYAGQVLKQLTTPPTVVLPNPPTEGKRTD